MLIVSSLSFLAAGNFIQQKTCVGGQRACGIGQRRVRQLEANAIKKLRGLMLEPA